MVNTLSFIAVTIVAVNQVFVADADYADVVKELEVKFGIRDAPGPTKDASLRSMRKEYQLHQSEATVLEKQLGRNLENQKQITDSNNLSSKQKEDLADLEKRAPELETKLQKVKESMELYSKEILKMEAQQDAAEGQRQLRMGWLIAYLNDYSIEIDSDLNARNRHHNGNGVDNDHETEHKRLSNPYE